jgi:PHD/YefM family antitoxin component YafN of YafNO toxin-antitoxin module
MNDPVKFSPSQLISSTQLARGVSQQLDKATKAPLFIQRDQEVQWVLISLDEYRRMLRKE